jgi:CxxC motif-containing protein (DUF1111 family)
LIGALLKTFLLIIFIIVSGWLIRADESATNSELAGGGTTAFDATRNAFSLSARNLTLEHHTPYTIGSFFFNESWLAATLTPSDRDGLGPLFISRSCFACHTRNGRGQPPDSFVPTETVVVRLSVPGRGPDGGPKPEPTYGLQLQTHALPGFKPEAKILGAYQLIRGTYDDGEAYYLRRPTFLLSDLGYGPMQTNAVISPLVAPAIIGLGLLEAVPEESLKMIAAQDQKRADGISGQLNIVWDAAAKQLAVGRFGWKAEQPNVRQQCAAAFNGDMGLTTTLYPQENYTAAENICTNSPSGGQPEVSDEILAATVLFAKLIAVPARRDRTNEVVLRGEKLFRQLNCAACHVPELETGNMAGFPELSHQLIHPYTDLLLHDMGPGLSDRRQIFQASGSQWRTPPLWGIGLVSTVNNHNYFLHDGRATGLSEAILWHGGEAENSQEQFRRLKKNDREALLRFLQSL